MAMLQRLFVARVDDALQSLVHCELYYSYSPRHNSSGYQIVTTWHCRVFIASKKISLHITSKHGFQPPNLAFSIKDMGDRFIPPPYKHFDTHYRFRKRTAAGMLVGGKQRSVYPLAELPHQVGNDSPGRSIQKVMTVVMISVPQSSPTPRR